MRVSGARRVRQEGPQRGGHKMERKKTALGARLRSFRGLTGGGGSSLDATGAQTLTAEAEHFSSSTPRGFPRRDSGRTVPWRRNPSIAATNNSASHLRRRSASTTIAVDEESNDLLPRRATEVPNAVGDDPIENASATAWDTEALTRNYQDVREELELSGHNLTSVLNNPRETFMDSLYEAAFETTFEAEPHPPLEMAGVPHGLREVTLQDVEPFIRRTGSLSRVFARNHRRLSGAGGRMSDESGGILGKNRDKAGGSSSAVLLGSITTNGPSLRLASSFSTGDGSDRAGGLEEAPRYGLGLRRLRNTASGVGFGGGPSGTGESARGGDHSSAGGTNGAGGDKLVDRDLGGGSVAQCFEQVPSMFFDKGFSLQEPAVFESAVMAAGSEQPERLAHYLDLVEVCLLRQISQRSNAFFEGLKTSQDLQTHVGGACTTLYQLRENMGCMQQDVLVGPMRVPQLQRRRNNLASLEATLEKVAGVQQSQAAVQGLLAAEDYLGALDILQSAKNTVQNDLAKLQSLKHVGRKLAEYEALVSELLSSRFVHLAVTIPLSTEMVDGNSSSFDTFEDMDWEEQESEENSKTFGERYRSCEGGRETRDVGNGHGGGVEVRVIKNGAGEKLREELLTAVQGLLRLGEMEKVLGVVQERVSEDLKLIIRTVVGDFLATTDDSGELMDTFHLFGDEASGGELTSGKGSEVATGAGGEGGSEDQGGDVAVGGEGGEAGTGGGTKGAGVGAGAGPGGGQSVAKLKTLDGEAFCSCLEMCFEHMLAVLNRVSQVHEALASIVEAYRERKSPVLLAENGGGKQTVRRSPTAISKSQANGVASQRSVESWGGVSTAATSANARGGGGEGMQEIVKLEASIVMREDGTVIVDRSRACLKALSELMERSVSQLLGVRREHNCTKLRVEELKHLWDITVSFIQSVERMSGCTGYRLRSTLLSQAKAFVEAKHEANKTALVKRLDSEKWVQADVTPERQVILDRLSSGKVFPPSSSSLGQSGDNSSSDTTTMIGSVYGNGSPRMPNDLPAQPSFVTSERSGRKGARGERRREAIVDGENFKTVGSALVIAEMAVKFLQFSAQFPAIGTDVLTRIGELLRVFNSRATQLVLGAGAIHSAANLKSISAKHLALCSQSLGLVLTLIPHMRAALATCLPQKHRLLLAQMDTVAQDYRDHRDKIFSKFVSMIEELIEARSGSLKLTDWDAPGSSTAGGGDGGDGGGAGAASEPCQFTADLRKGVTAMHNVLQQQLPPEQLKNVFMRIFVVITRKVPACFEREGVSPSTAAGRQRILDDIGFVCTDLSMLRGVDASTLGLEQAIADRYSKPRGLMSGRGSPAG